MLSFKQYLKEAKKKTIAIFPGSFKPPHLGHLHTVKELSKKADEVYVLISAPTKSERKTSSGGTITAQQSKKIWDTYIKDEGLKNVKVEISPKASSLMATYGLIKELRKQGDYNYILATSKKGDDIKRWKGAKENYDNEKELHKGNHPVNILDIDKNAIGPPKGGFRSATDIRNNIDDIEKYKGIIPDKSIKKVYDILH
jgi:cytidyltransferase-like protein